jgi:CxxC-x17-CxxC domain-containing protein
MRFGFGSEAKGSPHFIAARVPDSQLQTVVGFWAKPVEPSAGGHSPRELRWGKVRGMDYVDKILKCADCGNDFVFTAGEQLFFHDKQFKNDPKRCKSCKAKRVSSGGSSRPETRTVCSQCGAETTVPFKPTQGRPVLCRQCFQHKSSGASHVGRGA